jgi:hypothetical protein
VQKFKFHKKETEAALDPSIGIGLEENFIDFIYFVKKLDKCKT